MRRKARRLASTRPAASSVAARRAALALQDLIGRRTVTCDERDVDRYGRIVAQCHQGDTDISEWLVGQGLVPFRSVLRLERRVSHYSVPDTTRRRVLEVQALAEMRASNEALAEVKASVQALAQRTEPVRPAVRHVMVEKKRARMPPPSRGDGPGGSQP